MCTLGICWKSGGSFINIRTSEKHIFIYVAYKRHNVIYISICSRCNGYMYVVWCGSLTMAQSFLIPYNFLGDRAMLCSKEATIGGFLNSFKTNAAVSGKIGYRLCWLVISNVINCSYFEASTKPERMGLDSWTHFRCALEGGAHEQSINLVFSASHPVYLFHLAIHQHPF